MINFFKNKEKTISGDNDSLCKITALLIHAAKIDENYEETVGRSTMVIGRSTMLVVRSTMV